jgi:macrolide transport system ATP-binding/permease protein
MREWVWRLVTMMRRGRLTSQLEEELQFHHDMAVDDERRRGASPRDAVRRAHARVGRVALEAESTRASLGIRWLDGAVGDLRHAVRALTRRRGFGAVAVLVLAASVAINTLIFFMLDGVVLRPLPYASPERLIRIYEVAETQPKFPLSIGRFLDYRASATSLEGIALYTGQNRELSGVDGRSEALTGVAITSDFFSVLGQPPSLGRSFTDADLRLGTRLVILSHRLWRDRFGSDPAIVGKAIRLDRIAWTVIGVAAQGFQHVGGEYRSPLQGESVDVWLPLGLNVTEGGLRAAHFCNAIARIRPGVSEAQVRDELQRMADAYSKRYPSFGVWRARVEPLAGEVTGRSGQIVWLLVGAGALVLIVACANIAGLSVARALARRDELALRRALGATRAQLARVGLAENLVIGMVGATLGLLLAAAGLPLLRGLLPTDFPRAHEVGLTWRSGAFAVAVAIVTSLIAGLMPSLGRQGGPAALHRVTSSRESRRLRAGLVVGEIALAGLLCAGALFLLRSYEEIGARDHGFRSDHALTFRVTVQRAGRPNPGDVARGYEDIRSKILEIGGVASVGAATNLPWSGYDENASFRVSGRPMQPNDDGYEARYQGAGPGYFEAAGMRVIAGRLFDRATDAIGKPNTLIVNDALANRYFPRGDALGTTVNVFGADRQIVGIVGGIRDFPADPDIKAAFWLPLGQIEFQPVFFVVRTSGVDAASLTAAVTSAVHAVDPDLPLAEVRTLEARASAALAARRFALWLFQAFALLALILAAAGVYGLLTYIVRQRRKELGIRAALGASRLELSRMVLVDGLRMAVIGGAMCLALIPFGGSLLQAYLYNVRSIDLTTVTGAPAALVVAAFVASLAPAWSAMRSDPSAALREE